MKRIAPFLLRPFFVCAAVLFALTPKAQVIISQYYEGTGTNKWIELTNLGNTAVNTASPQLRLGLWSVAGSTGNIVFSGAATQTVDLTITIPAKGTVLIGNTANGTEIPYLTAASAVQTSNTVINFNGNDGIALLNASNTIIDRFGTGINATDISYVRNASVTAQSATYVATQWTAASIATVQTATTASSNRLGVHVPPLCTTPTTQPTVLTFGTTTSNSIAGSFTAAAGADEYLVVRSTASTLSANPVDGTVYNVGNTLGGGVVVSRDATTSFTASGLNSNTTYFFFIYSLKSTSCSGGPKYLTTAPLSGNRTTLLPSCTTPAAQPTALTFGAITTTSIAGSFTAASGVDEYLVVRSTAATLSANPVDGTIYNTGNTLGGGIVVSRGAATSFTASGLNINTNYFFFIFSVNNTSCSGGPRYLTAVPLTASAATVNNPCVVPAAAPTALTFGTITSSSIAASFTGSGADEYLVVRSNVSTLSANPVNGTVYNAGNVLGGGNVVSRGAATSFSASGLTPQTVYYFFVFALNSNCSGGPLYLTTTVLTGNTSTAPANTSANFYFGNMHAHSSYSDGNADDVTKIPADDYAFAKNALCMDYLGISEHNHVAAGMHLADWQPGRTQAAASTTTGFVAMYGMEWGVISGGGHVIVYGVDSLVGWDPNEYQIFVPKSLYTGTGGLFDIINRHGGNALAYLAHPNSTDYNNVLNGTFDVQADNAIVGSAVESGPAFSTNITYTNPPATLMSYLSYYRNMLSKGYHLGPVIDHDNHNMTFGRTNKSRTVIMAPSLSENDLLGAMRQMRFYASHDCAAKITFTINNQPMGSILRMNGAPIISVTSVTSSPVSSLKVMFGVPGSGVAATQLTAVASGSLAYTDNAITNLSAGYYYLDITETDGSRIITSPIWYTRDDAAIALPLITSFFTVNETDDVVLKWTTENESGSELFSIERSVDDGRTWQTIGRNIWGSGKSNFPLNYAIKDMLPYDGRALYRLVQTSTGGDVSYSEWKLVDRSTVKTNYLLAFPNPIQGILYLKTGVVKNEQSNIELLDMTGRIVLIQNVRLTEGTQYFSVDVSKLTAGTYMLKMNMDGKVVTRLVHKL
jgi:trimeric autotransporter adhesin